jgi:hypothetical protein
MRVTGLFVNSPGGPLEDPFYYVNLNDNSVSAGACPDCFRYNIFSDVACICGAACGGVSYKVADLLAEPYPPFSPSHEYAVKLDLGSGPPKRISFGMADGGCYDNSGTHTVTITCQ